MSEQTTPNAKSKAKNRAANQAALKQLMEAYPSVFNRDNVRPLKIGIQEDLVADEKLAKNKIKRALASYVRAPQYFKALQVDADRVDLQGESAGKVTESEAAHAKEQLKAFQQRRRERIRDQEKQRREDEKQERFNNKLEMLLNKGA